MSFAFLPQTARTSTSATATVATKTLDGGNHFTKPNGQKRKNHQTRQRDVSIFMAIVYFPDDSNGPSVSSSLLDTDDDDHYSFWTPSQQHEHEQNHHLMQVLNTPRKTSSPYILNNDDDDEDHHHHHDYVGTLARLAAAFAPPGHALHLPNINSVSVIAIDETHLDIQTVICDQMGCVTVKVPIIFPHACQTVDDEECILHQLEELDHQAEEFLFLMEQQQQEQVQQQQEQRELSDQRTLFLNALNDYSADLVYPPWWVPSGPALADECQNIRRLLNGPDFESEVRALAQSGYDHHDHDHDAVHPWTMEKAVVCQVSPAGFYLRALVVAAVPTSSSSSSSSATTTTPQVQYRLVDIPMAFGMVADTVADLRAVVLGSIAATTDEEYMEEAAVAHTAASAASVDIVMNQATSVVSNDVLDIAPRVTHFPSEEETKRDLEHVSADAITVDAINVESPDTEHREHDHENGDGDNDLEFHVDNMGRLTRIK